MEITEKMRRNQHAIILAIYFEKILYVFTMQEGKVDEA